MESENYSENIKQLAEEHRFDTDTAVKRAISSVKQLVENTSSPPILFHYTNASGLFGILQSDTLWATHYEYLNDPSEVLHLTQVAHELFKEELASFSSSKQDNVISDTPENLRINLMRIFCDYSNLSTHYAPYVISFSANGDLLGQWRAYGDNGYGYSLGFQQAVLNNIVEASDGRMNLWPVIYNHEHQQLIVKAIFGALFDELVEPFFATRSGFVTNEALRMAFECIHRLFGMMSPLAKHHAYSDEEEWRIIVHGIRPEAVLDQYRQTPFPNSPIISRSNDELHGYNVRVSGRRIIPYTCMQLPESNRGDLYNCLVVGPCQLTPSTEPALKLLLFRLGLYPGVNILESEVPYRAI